MTCHDAYPQKTRLQSEVEWAGDTASVIDRGTGEIIKAYVFVAAMSYSTYAYAEAFPIMKQACWLKASVHMLEYIGGVLKIIIPDNTSKDIWSKKTVHVTIYHPLSLQKLPNSFLR